LAHAILLEHLSKTYTDKRFRRFQALRDVSLAVAPGEAFGFVGPNGAGKSTTIKILTGTIRANSGSASMFSVPVSDYSARKGLGYVPENPYLYDYLTPLEMLTMGAKLHGISSNGLKAHCMSWLERFGIAHVANKRIRSFSKGMTQRVALAHALVVRPRLLILDEPLSGLDPLGRKEVVDILLEYRQSGGTVFFSSHILHDVERLADRFGIIHKGILRTVRTPSELTGMDAGYIVCTEGDTPLPGAEQDGVKRWCISATADKLWQVLDQVRAADHRVLEVKAAGPSLEQAFLSFIAAEEEQKGE
jgi:ABC-2 type transport system ATP-binding protein